jgi:hypothetical protein
VDLLQHILHGFTATIVDVAPIVAVLLAFQFAIIRKPPPNPHRIVIGFVYVVVGLTLFLVGLEEALFPIGEAMALQLTDPTFVGPGAGNDWTAYYWVYIFAFAVGFSATVAEPALIAVALKAQQISGGGLSAVGLRIAVAIGVAVGVAVGTFRIVSGTPIHYYIMVGYLIVIIQTVRAPRMIVPLAYDSGGVTTSTVTVPVVAALGLGLASTIPGRSPLIDGFGLIAFASLFPMMSVMGYAQAAAFFSRRSSNTEAALERE